VSLLVYNAKNILDLGFWFIVGNVIKWGRFFAILAQVTWPAAQLLDGSTVNLG